MLDLVFVIKQRLADLQLEQRDLAGAAQVTESYISQLLSRKKAPPAPDRSDIYEKLERVLQLPAGELRKLADMERKAAFKKKIGDPPAPLYAEVRDLLLRKCVPEKARQLQTIFGQQPFGELERLVTEKLLHVIQGVAKKELDDENWLRLVARLSGRSYEQMRVLILEFLEADIFTLSGDNCVTFMDPIIATWDIDLATFGMDIVLNHRVAPGQRKKFEYVELELDETDTEEPGFREFLDTPSLSAGASEEELKFLSKLRFGAKHPTPLYYYRELQSLRDPLHFPSTATPKGISIRRKKAW